MKLLTFAFYHHTCLAHSLSMFSQHTSVTAVNISETFSVFNIDWFCLLKNLLETISEFMSHLKQQFRKPFTCFCLI